jgi:hypothetical protein
MSLPRPALVLALVLALTAGVSCSDPVHDGAVAAQGKEVTGVPIGEFHRAGQPCNVCHEDHGPASNDVFTVSGTVFAGPDNYVGVDSAEVRMTDSGGSKYIAHTNCVGNFFVRPSDWNPRFPILVHIAKAGSTRSMNTQIGREGSCGNCHVKVIDDDNRFGSMPHVYLFSGPDPAGPSNNCAVNPDLGTPQ